jgi:ribosome-binding ATPase YchF (GTP1/OBG family)
MELAIFFISGIQLTLLAILLYQYGSINKNYNVIKKNQTTTDDSYEKWIQMTTKQLDEIREHISTSDFADAATFNREITAFSERLNAVESSITILANKEDNDVKTLKDSIKEIKIYLHGVISGEASNKGY